MKTQYRLELLTTNEAAQWDDLIASCEGRDLFHRKAWLDYLAASRDIAIRMWAIREGNRIAGYFPAGIVTKGPFRILGSPLKSWATNFMGPVVGSDFNVREFLQAIDDLARQEHLSMVELESQLACEEVLTAAGYEAVPGWTYIVKLTPENPQLIWDAFESSCRNKIRKASKLGLSAEDTDDPTLADEFYDQYIDLMRHKGLVPSYPREYPRLLFDYLKKKDLLFALRVRDGHGRVLATGLFPHDHRTLYFWAGASWRDGREFAPNDYLQWHAMSLAAQRGLRVYNMCGYGRFKKKFGGTLTEIKRWHKCYRRVTRWARRGYELYFEKRLRLRGWWHNRVLTYYADRNRPN